MVIDETEEIVVEFRNGKGARTSARHSREGVTQVRWEHDDVKRIVENARFLMEMGEHIERVAIRLGTTVDTLQKQLERNPA